MVAAGIRMVAAQWAQDGTALTDDSASATGTWEQWGTETVTFPDPGRPVVINAAVSGSYVNTTLTNTDGFVRVAISVDGGSTFSTGSGPGVSVGTSVGNRGGISALATVSGTPTGDIVIKAEIFMNATSTSARAGWLQATVTPQ